MELCNSHTAPDARTVEKDMKQSDADVGASSDAPQRIPQNRFVNVDVCGRHFRTTLHTLISERPSLLFDIYTLGEMDVAVMHAAKVYWQDDGTLFLDHDSDDFSVVLQYLRYRQLDPAAASLVGVRLIAQALGIASLVAVCEAASKAPCAQSRGNVTVSDRDRMVMENEVKLIHESLRSPHMKHGISNALVRRYFDVAHTLYGTPVPCSPCDRAE